MTPDEMAVRRLEIEERLEQGAKITEVAREFGVSEHAVTRRYRELFGRRVRLAEREEELKVLMSKGLSSRRIGEIMGFDGGTIRGYAKAKGWSLRKSARRRIAFDIPAADFARLASVAGPIGPDLYAKQLVQISIREKSAHA